MTIEALSPTEMLGELSEVERKNAPKTLYAEGEKTLVTSGLRVSVVGSRKVSQKGERRAAAVTKALVDKDIIVVSGLAKGVDTIAHTTAICAGGRTIAVLGTPLDKAYPAENKELLYTIKRDHLAISQFPLGCSSPPRNFPIRNRTMALISDATIIIEASEKSGTLHQGWEALRLGRLLFLLESVVNDTNLTWPTEMLKYGAQVLNREVFEQALDELPNFTTCAAFDF